MVINELLTGVGPSALYKMFHTPKKTVVFTSRVKEEIEKPEQHPQSVNIMHTATPNNIPFEGWFAGIWGMVTRNEVYKIMRSKRENTNI